MKRRINLKLLCIALLLVLIGCEICIIGATNGFFYIRTKGTPSDNITNLFDSVLSGDGDACVLHTDSYRKIDFDASGEDSAVASICKALQKSYSIEPIREIPGEDQSLASTNPVVFSYLDLNKMTDDIAEKFEEHVFDIVLESDTNVTGPDGKYIPEIYEKAYEQSLSEVLEKPEAYYTSEQVELSSAYDLKTGNWSTKIDSSLAGMLLGGLTNGIMSDTLSIPKAVRTYVEDSIDTLKGEPVKTRKNYTLPYSSTVGPKPDPSKYFYYSPEEADQVLNLIAYARACGLLGDQQVIFNPDSIFYPDNIICYCDETILVICWKEYINGCVCNCMEVKVADGSQIKRKITADTYNSGILDTMSNMSAATNAVACMNGDYYAYRFYGTTVYQGQLQRYDQACETLMIDDQGRFIFYYPDGRSADDLQAFITQNNVQFGMSFGPVLVEDYVPRYYTYGYAEGLGQMTEDYTRAAFGEFDDLHYLFMTSGYAYNASPPANLDAFIEILLTKNLKNVYNLDGGQTAEIVIQNTPYNQIDYLAERQMSDMVFFATAIPENES